MTEMVSNLPVVMVVVEVAVVVVVCELPAIVYASICANVTGYHVKFC